MRGRLRVNVAAAWAAVVAAIPAVAADGADAWPATSPEWLDRGAGGGIAILPVLLWWLVLLAWMRTTAWVREESRRLRLPADRWTAICGLTTLAAALVAWWIPTAWAALPLVLLAWLVPVVVFATARNPRVAEHERVLTVKHARRVLARLLGRFGIDISEDPGAAVPLVALAPAAAATATDTEADALRLQAAEVEGYEQARTLLLDAVMARAATLRFVTSERGIEPQHEVDGLWVKPKVRKPPPSRGEKETWEDAPVPPRDVTDAALKALRDLAKGPPQGAFTLFVDGKPRRCELKSVATRDRGEVTSVSMGRMPPVFKTPDDLGMPRATAEESKAGVERLADRLRKLLALEKGMLVVSGPPKSGVTTTFDVVLLTADRLLRDFVSIEDEASPAREIQNVKPVRYDSRTGGKPLEALATAMRDYPRGVVARDVRDPAFVAELARLADEGLFVIISIPALDAADAIERLIKGGVEPALLARAVVGSLSQRLVRKLCPQCREEHPPAELKAPFKDLPDRRTGIRKPHGCALCAGIGYLGRTGLFELVSGESFRAAVASAPSADVLRKAARADKMQLQREEGIDLVCGGVTSVDELQRVLAPPAAKKPATRPRPAS